ncbi:hypothetical protein H2248_008387 [Termitomyces sp. 'cryptogamus']|nr:hypothetical protein H2248_008387 [Termitomyces sp. 'cryptogamus']
MLTLFAGSLVLVTVAWIISPFLWQLLIDLGNFPGPKPESFLKGNLGQLFDPYSGWSFIGGISRQCMDFIS